MRKTILILLLLNAISSFSQDNPWKTWDERYKSIEYKQLIEYEKQYADSVENNPEIAQYFTRIGNYKLIGKYLGESRRIKKDVLLSMMRVFKLFIGNPEKLYKSISSEFLFEIEGEKVWFPIQQVLETDFKKEIKKNDNVVLYCLFLNEHSQDKVLYNTFLVSEFYLYQP